MANHFLHAKAADAGELRKAVYSRPVESLPQAKPEIMASVWQKVNHGVIGVKA